MSQRHTGHRGARLLTGQDHLTLEIRRVAAPGTLRWSALHSVHLSSWWTLSSRFRLGLSRCLHRTLTFHRLPERIKAHASICFLALILYRVMRQRLKLAGSDLSPETALADLRRIQRHTVSIDSAAPIHGVSTIHPRQADVLAALNVKKPTQDAQLSLL